MLRGSWLTCGLLLLPSCDPLHTGVRAAAGGASGVASGGASGGAGGGAIGGAGSGTREMSGHASLGDHDVRQQPAATSASAGQFEQGAVAMACVLVPAPLPPPLLCLSRPHLALACAACADSRLFEALLHISTSSSDAPVEPVHVRSITRLICHPLLAM